MRKSLLLSTFVVFMFAPPAQAQFCPGTDGWVFDDVLASDPFCGYITWMAQNGVSLGCQIIDGAHRLYCPNSDVSRTQMAAFMNRLTQQPDTISPTVGTITKPGGVFLHNFGTDNTFVGVGSGNFQMTGAYNTGVGTAALSSNATGVGNTAIGNDAARNNTSGIYNTAIGAGALALTTSGSDNTAVGAAALNWNSSGTGNTTLGSFAMHFSQSGHGNTALGTDSLSSNLTGHFNTAVGKSALANGEAASSNTAVGVSALFSNSADGNTAVGAAALSGNTSGSDNVAVGNNALSNNTGASNNTAIGAFSLLNGQVGGDNTAVGRGALSNLGNGIHNIALGSAAGNAVVVGNQNIFIGHAGTAVDSLTIRIGNVQSRTFVAGIRGVTTLANDAINVVIDSNGQLGTISSSREGKDDIADMSDASAALMQLRPVTFHYKADRDPAGPRLQYGLIAEEVAEVYPGMVATRNGKVETVMYQYLAPMLLNEFQKQQRTIEAQALELKMQRTEIAELKRAVDVLMARTGAAGLVAAK